jgi:hypothetical protein
LQLELLHRVVAAAQQLPDWSPAMQQLLAARDAAADAATELRAAADGLEEGDVFGGAVAWLGSLLQLSATALCGCLQVGKGCQG